MDRDSRFTVYAGGLIRRHVDNFRIGRLNHNHALVFDYFRFHCLLLSGVQSALVLCLPSMLGAASISSLCCARKALPRSVVH